MSKLLIVVGITGNQGGSVANIFLQDGQWRIRGLTRNKQSPASQALTARGVEMVEADLDDPPALMRAFQGANLIFSVTDFWQQFFDPANHAKAKDLGISNGEMSYRREYAHGKNIADAATATVETLDEVGLIASTLSSAKKCSKGKYQELWHFDAKADIFPTYVQQEHPALAKKTSYLQTGCFMTSWRIAGEAYLAKMADGSRLMRLSTDSTKDVPHLDVNRDTGSFVKALTQLPPGKTVMAAGEWCPWPKWIETWGRVVGLPNCNYKQITVDDFDQALPGGFGKELGDMFEYSGEPGYDGGDPEVLRLDDLKKMGMEIPVTTLEEYFKRENWSQLLGK